MIGAITSRAPPCCSDRGPFLGPGWGLPSFNGRMQDFRVHSGSERSGDRDPGALRRWSGGQDPPSCESSAADRARAARHKVADLGAKHSHSSDYGEHLQRRAGAFWRDERAW